MQKKSENALAEDLKSVGLSFEREITIAFSCFSSETARARIDYTIDMGSHVVLLENDECQHRQYPISCELRRMTDVTAAIQCSSGVTSVTPRPLLWVRFNPDGFKINGATQQVERKVRIETLVDFIREYHPTKPMEVAYFYYNLNNAGTPEICDDAEYATEMKPLICITHPGVDTC